jgi:hypothetical protein
LLFLLSVVVQLLPIFAVCLGFVNKPFGRVVAKRNAADGRDFKARRIGFSREGAALSRLKPILRVNMPLPARPIAHTQSFILNVMPFK